MNYTKDQDAWRPMIEEKTLLLTQSEISYPPSDRRQIIQNAFHMLGRWKIFLFSILSLVCGMTLMYFFDESGSPFSTNTKFEQVASLRGENIAKQQDKHNETRYTYFQGFGFQVYTGGAAAVLQNANGTPTNNDECKGLHSYGHVEGDLQCYLGYLDPIKDVRHRLRVMKDAVERAYEQSKKESHILKVFIAPEFFWRGKNGAYIFANETSTAGPHEGGGRDVACGPVCEILRGLEGFVADKKYEDWLFVFGTVIASEVLPSEDEWDYLFYNFAPLYKGYDPKVTTHHGKRFLVPKRYVSVIDFLTPRRNFNDTLAKELRPINDIDYDEDNQFDTTVFNPYDLSQNKYDYDMWLNYKEELSQLGYAIIEYNWFVMNGIAFSIEICLDHRLRSALDSFTADLVTGSKLRIPSGSSNGLEYVPIPKHQAQISLISSAGMVVYPASLALAHEGTVFLQDGMDNAPARMYWENDNTCQKGLVFDGGSEAIQRKAYLSPTDVVFEYNLINSYEALNLYTNKSMLETSFKGVFSVKEYPPKIHVYQPIKIADVSG